MKKTHFKMMSQEVEVRSTRSGMVYVLTQAANKSARDSVLERESQP
jgi:hypothetical protein